MLSVQYFHVGGYSIGLATEESSHSESLSDETQKAVGPFCLVSMAGQEEYDTKRNE